MRIILREFNVKVVPKILATITIVFNLLCFSHAVAEAKRRRPNILVIVTDEAVVGAESLLIEWTGREHQKYVMRFL